MRQQENRLFGMIHGSIGQAWLILDNQRNAVLSRNILGGHDHKLFPRNTCPKRDLFDLASRNSAPNGRPEQHVGYRYIIDILRAASDLVATFLTRNRPPHDV